MDLQITTMAWVIGIGFVSTVVFGLAVVMGRRSRASAGLGLSDRLPTAGTKRSAG